MSISFGNEVVVFSWGNIVSELLPEHDSLPRIFSLVFVFNLLESFAIFWNLHGLQLATGSGFFSKVPGQPEWLAQGDTVVRIRHTPEEGCAETSPHPPLDYPHLHSTSNTHHMTQKDPRFDTERQICVSRTLRLNKRIEISHPKRLKSILEVIQVSILETQVILRNGN